MAEIYRIQTHQSQPPLVDGSLALQLSPASSNLLKPRGTLLPFPEQRVRKEPHTLTEYMEDFSTHYQHHGLPRDWYKFKGIGFSMKSQMGLLESEYDKTAVQKWTQQTSRDILGFCLEYLSRGLVFAYQYNVHRTADGKKELVDPLYGNKRMIDMVDRQERGGAVTEALAKAEQFFLDPSTPDGSMFVMPSPAGPSGLTTDRGEAITYPDSFWFVITKHGDSFPGITIKTDFTHEEYRKAIKVLTGQEIPEHAS
ncbi:MAG: hypothetical protein KGL95_08165, partial [Patescibacteria group bacterium]|nr:hypothetical protein [Patescibacteria group bacterium]